MEKFTPPHMSEFENQNAPEATVHRYWASAHPYTAALCATAALLVIGTTIVVQHSAVNPPNPDVSAWGGDITTTLNPSDAIVGSVTANQQDISHAVQNDPSYTIPDLTSSTPPQPAQNTADDSLNYTKFMARIGQLKQNGTSTSKGITDITYAFPPASLFTVSSPNSNMTPVQQKLYTYGNEVGSYIQSYEEQHPNQTQTLKDQIEDQENPAKVQAVVQMGHDLEGVGTGLLGMEDVPAEMTAAHAKLAASYQKIGQNLALVPQSHGNDALLKAIGTYNASADVFAKDFASFASAFSTYGVTFGTEDAGSVFTFTYSGGM